MMLKVFTCTDHEGRYPVGVASVVVAANEVEARTVLDLELKEHSLPSSAYNLREISIDKPRAFVLNDGDY